MTETELNISHGSGATYVTPVMSFVQRPRCNMLSRLSNDSQMKIRAPRGRGQPRLSLISQRCKAWKIGSRFMQTVGQRERVAEGDGFVCLYVYVCVCVGIYAYTYINMYIYSYLYMYKYEYVYIYIQEYVYVKKFGYF